MMKLDDRILQAIPLMAPVPTAWMIGVATNTIMGFPWPVSLISALTVEGLGFVSINTANEMREFNRHLNGVELKQKMQAPVWQAYGVAGLYLITATLMTVVLHIAPSLEVFAPLPFIIMTAAGGWLYALRKEQSTRVEKWQIGRLSAKATKHIRRSASQATKATKQSSQTASQATKATKQSSQTAKIYDCTWPGCEWSTEQSAAVQRGGDPQAALAAHISHHNRKANKIMAEKEKVQS
jgi:hypothetical protein